MIKVKDCNYYTPDINDVFIGYFAELQIPLHWYEWEYCTYSGFEESWRLKH
jgi:hypothetical protein